MQYTQRQLEECLKYAYSYENRAGWDAKELSTTCIGTVQRGNRIYDVYVDTNHSYWFKNKIIRDGKIMSEYEAIFGHPERRQEWRKKYI